MATTPKFTVSPATNVVRVSIPADVYGNLNSFTKIQKEILGKLGCLACCSGWDIRYNVQRQFIIDAKLGVQEVVA
jgi:hypothetical protein